ncbi:DUF2306 domain-containing protein [Nocardiopsis halotolerans]|uniref:DUF2306 domain-containing protein n=1 Tax=Nocardiopsis halotolerans TaxID=124252 RepID=UPI00034B866C|nr:DUF2306 domain-containing protein [Nocardiopsis halotolerans]
MAPPATAPADHRPARSTVRWWERPWVVPLTLSTLTFLVFAVPPYLGLDPGQARVPIREDVPWHYAMLVSHILGGTVLMILVILQVWPWLRRHHPRVHRWSGRVYVMFGIPFVGVPALLISPLTSWDLSARVGTVLWAVAWLSFTVAGYVMARRRDFARHREWMLRGFVLLYGIALNRLVMPLLILVTLPLGSGEKPLDLLSASMFLSWMLPLLLLEWWLRYRRPARRRRTAPRVSSTA